MRHLKAVVMAGAAIAAMMVTPAIAATRAEILSTMKRASEFMVDKASVRGGYVWSMLPDKSRRWGEMEAYPTMVWVQPPGTDALSTMNSDARFIVVRISARDAATAGVTIIAAIAAPATKTAFRCRTRRLP